MFAVVYFYYVEIVVMSHARQEYEKAERERRDKKVVRSSEVQLQRELDRAYARIDELEEELATLRAMEHYAGDGK